MFYCPTFIAYSGIPTTPAAGALSWYKPENIQQTASVVTSWTDAGSTAQNLTANNAPAYVSNALNGLAGVALNGINQNLDNGVNCSSVIPTAGFNSFAVFQFTATPSTDGCVWGSGTATVIIPSITFPTSTTAKGTVADGTTKRTGAVTVALSTFYIGATSFDGSNFGMRINGTNASTVALGTYIGSGNVFRVGVNNGTYMTGTVCEVILYGSLSAGAVTQTLLYLQGRYGLTP